MEYENKVLIRVFLGLLPFFIIIFRFIAIVPSVNPPSIDDEDIISPPNVGSDIMIFLGSGGHTGEMMKLVSNVEIGSFNRTWVVSSTDTTSLLKCKQFEQDLESEYQPHFLSLHRARSVGEPLISSIKNTILSFVDTFSKLYKLPKLPTVLLLNGPGTSVPLAYILFVFRFFGLGTTKIIYVESLARVKELSLSGKLLMPISDRFIVQWPQLANKYKRAEYYGILV